MPGREDGKAEKFWAEKFLPAVRNRKPEIRRGVLLARREGRQENGKAEKFWAEKFLRRVNDGMSRKGNGAFRKSVVRGVAGR